MEHVVASHQMAAGAMCSALLMETAVRTTIKNVVCY